MRRGRVTHTGAMTTDSDLRRERALLWTLAAVQFTHIVDFMVMMPLGPQLTVLFGISDAQFGLLVSAYTFAAGAAGLAASLVIDRYSRRGLLLVMYAGFALATLACALAPGYGTLMAARVAAGVFGGVLSALVQTIVAEGVPYERRGRAMGVVMSAFSLATVAGVPAALALAQAFSWHAPFYAIAAASVPAWWLAWRSVPPLDAHLRTGEPPRSTWAPIAQVLADRNHWRAFGLVSLLMGSAFAIIPFITIVVTTNGGLPLAQVPIIYLVGGVATFASARAIGALADRFGKVRTFRAVALLALVPMFAMTHLPPLGLAGVLVVTTLFFMLVSGRMIPGLALIGAAAQAPVRGAFLSLNGSVQSLAMGLAAWVGGLLLSRGPDGRVEGYGTAGWLALACTLGAVWLVGRLRTHDAPGAAARPG